MIIVTMTKKFALIWLPSVAIVSMLCLLSYATVQHSLRTGAYDPQMQMAEDGARALEGGEAPAALVPRTAHVEISESLAVYTLIYDDGGTLLESGAVIGGEAPVLPAGVLDYTKAHGEDRLTWQPKVGVRQAIVLRHFGGAHPGTILVGRSMREIEKRISDTAFMAGIVWLASIVIITLTALAASVQKKG